MRAVLPRILMVLACCGLLATWACTEQRDSAPAPADGAPTEPVAPAHTGPGDVAPSAADAPTDAREAVAEADDAAPPANVHRDVDEGAPPVDVDVDGDDPVADAASPSAPSAPDTPDIPDTPGAPETDDEREGWHEATGDQGVFTLAWRPAGDLARVPRNTSFAIDVELERSGQPAPGASIQVSGFMPAHGHGMVQIPLVEDLGQGRYRVEGLLLHMRGEWQLRFTVRAPRVMETVTFELEL